MDSNEARDARMAVALDGPYTNYLHFASDRQPHQQPTTPLPDPECGMLDLKNSDRTQASDSLGAN